MRRIRLFCLLSLLTFLSAFYIILTHFPRYLDINHYKSSIEKALVDLVGMPVSFGRIDFSLQDGLSLVVYDLNISQEESGIRLSVKRSAILFKIVPLLKERRLVVKSVRLFSPEIKMKMEKGKGEYLLAGLPHISFNDKAGGGKEKPFMGVFSTMAAAGIDVFNGKIHLSIPGRSDAPENILLEGFSFQSRRDKSKTQVRVKGGFRIFSNGSTAKIGVTGEITKTDGAGGQLRFLGKVAASSLSLRLIEPFRSFPLYGFKPDTAVDFFSTVETDFLKEIKLKGDVKEGRVEVLTGAAEHGKKRRELPVTLNFDINRTGENVDISSLRLIGKGYSVLAHGNMRGIFEDDPLVNFELKSSELDLAELKERLPENLFGDKIDHFLNEDVLGGRIRVTKAQYSGSYNALLEPLEVETLRKMTLVVEMKNSSTLLPTPFDSVERVNGIVRLEKGDLFLDEASFTYRSCDFKKMDVSVANILSSPTVSVSLNGNIDLAQTKVLAANLLPASRLSTINSLSGNALLTLKAAGTLGDKDSMTYEAEIDLLNAGFRYKGLPTPVQSLQGSLFFSENHVELERIEWEMGGGHFGIDGALGGLQNPYPDFDLWLEAGIDVENIKKFGYTTPRDLVLKSGPVTLSAAFKSDEKGILLDGEMDLTAAEYLYSGFEEKASGFNNKISFSGRYEEKELALNRLRVELGGSHFDVSGIVPFSGNLLPKVRIVSDQVAPADLGSILKNIKGSKKGNISFSVDVKGESPFNYRKDLTTQIALKDASFYVGKKEIPFRQISGQLDFWDNKLTIEDFLFQFDEGKIVAKGFLTGLPKPDIRVDLEADKLNLNTIFPPKKKNILEEKKEKITDTKKRYFRKYTGKVELGEGLYRNIEFNTAKMFLSINKSGVAAKPFSVKGFKGNFTGAWEFSKGTENTFSIEGNFKGIDMVSLENTMKIGLSDLEGRGDARVTLSGSGDGAKKFRETLNGEITLNIKNGRLHKLFILSKIFSLLNLQVFNMSSEGMSYDSITADVEIKNGVIETKNFLLNSNSFRMTGVGKIDLGKSKIDMIVGVQPFQTLDKVISHIPVIGKVLTGKKRSFIVSYYSVKGDLKKPEIDARPVESVGKGVLGILKRIITLPRDLVTGGEE